MLVVACLILFGLLVPISQNGRVYTAAGDLVHAPLFGSIAFALLQFAGRRNRKLLPLHVALTVALLVAGFGVLIEFAQAYFGRTTSVNDAIANGLGVAAALLYYYAVALHVSARRTSILLLLSSALVLVAAWRAPMAVIADVIKAQRDFPVLASFDSSVEFGRFYFDHCQPKLTRVDAADGQYAMEVAFSDKTKYPMFWLHEFVTDWSDVASLQLDLMLDQTYSLDSLRLVIKVVDQSESDQQQSHFARTVELIPGVGQQITISREELLAGPAGRALQLSKIATIEWIAIEPQRPATVRIDAISVMLQRP